ncbi:MAG: hypothetical protein NTV21_02980, partial [Planctomycetota bacterium]|nr:hypothetical protein [Planctomycetota bacterium]
MLRFAGTAVNPEGDGAAEVRQAELAQAVAAQKPGGAMDRADRPSNEAGEAERVAPEAGEAEIDARTQRLRLEEALSGLPVADAAVRIWSPGQREAQAEFLFQRALENS